MINVCSCKSSCLFVTEMLCLFYNLNSKSETLAKSGGNVLKSCPVNALVQCRFFSRVYRTGEHFITHLLQNLSRAHFPGIFLEAAMLLLLRGISTLVRLSTVEFTCAISGEIVLCATPTFQFFFCCALTHFSFVLKF